MTSPTKTFATMTDAAAVRALRGDKSDAAAIPALERAAFGVDAPVAVFCSDDATLRALHRGSPVATEEDDPHRAEEN